MQTNHWMEGWTMKRMAPLCAMALFLFLAQSAVASPSGAKNVAPETRDAKALLQEIRADVSGLMNQIVSHRYLKMVEQGKVPREAFKTFAAQQYRIVSRGLQNIALLVSRYGNLPSRDILNGFLQAEFSVLKALDKFATALGMSAEELHNAPPLPKALTFSTYESLMCLYGSDADLITAFYFDAEVWIKNATRVGKALQEKYGFTADQVEFFMMYANYQPSDDAVLPYLQAALNRGVSPQQIKESVYLLLSYELMFWDAMAEAAGT